MRCVICGQAPATRRINGVPACGKKAHDLVKRDKDKLRLMQRGVRDARSDARREKLSGILAKWLSQRTG